MCSGRLEIIADVAFTIPEASEISYGLRAIFHQSLDILLEAFKSVILNHLIGARSPIDVDFGGLSALSVLDLFPQDFVVL